MTFGKDSSEDAMIDPPHHDLLSVRFRGDQFDVTLPYCEVANGEIKSLKDGTVQVVFNNDTISMSFDDFASFVEKTFDTKGIVKLSVQPSFSRETFKIL